MIFKIRNLALTALMLVFFTYCGSPTDSKEEESAPVVIEEVGDNALTEAEKADGWKLLFDGSNITGWRGFNSTTMPETWIVEEGTLKSLGEGGDIGGDIVYEEVIGEFELSLD